MMNAPSPASYELFLRLCGTNLRKVLLTPLFLTLILLASQTSSAATYTVTNTADLGTGSLRDALTQVNAGTGGDTINFSGVTGTITVSSTLNITEDVTINGPGANVLAISGNDTVGILNIAAPVANVTISGLTITHGTSQWGAGIFVSAGAIVVNNCTFSYNTGVNGANINVGAAIQLNNGQSLTVNNSTFFNNRALAVGNPQADGGAIYANNTLVVNNSTFYNNSAVSHAGAIYATNGSKMTIRNSTIVGNTLTSTTGTSDGGGVVSRALTPTITNSIIAGNTALTNSDYRCIVACSTTPTGNLIGGGMPALGPLQYNGGSTMTMIPLQSGTGIIGAGLNSTLAMDQRGVSRSTLGASDLGAVQSYNLVVTTTDDSTNSGTTCTGSDTCSLRDAVNLANNHDSGDIIPLNGLQGTIALTSPLPDITSSINISGPGANLLTISGGNAYPVFHIANSGAANISGVTIANGNSGSPGGAGITNLGALLTLNNCEFNDNHAAGQDGGGLFNSGSSTATVTNCTFSGNSSDSGGAINNNGYLAVTNSTFVGNTSQADFGGGIFNQSVATITSSTITGNTAASQGGGVENIGTITVTNSVVAGNTEAGSPNDDCGSCGSQSAANLFSTAGTPVTAAQAMLAPLAYYGLNQTVHTMLPLPGSPVIQAGDPTLLSSDLSTDERLLPRTTNSKLDLGAVQTNYTGIQFVQQPSNTVVNQIMSPVVTMSVTESGTTAANITLPVTFAGTGALHGTIIATTQAPAIPGDPALASYGGQSGDTVGTGDTLTSSLTVTPTGVTPAQTLTATSDPFDITALTPTTVDFSPAPPTSVVYGSTPITLNGTANVSGTPTGQTVTYQVVSGPGSVAGNTLTFTGVGTVAVNASTTASGSYAAGTTPFNIIVTPAPLTVTVGNASRAVGAADPAFTSTATGLVNGDTLGGDITVAYSTTATATSPAGTYSITATLSGAAAGNYTPTIVHGTLTITSLTSVPVIDATGTGQGGTPGSTTPIFGEPVPVTITVPTVGSTLPTGTVTIFVNGNPVGTGTLGPNGTVTVTIPGGALPAGTDTITAGYGGDGHYGSSTSAPTTVTVTAAVLLDFSLTRTSAESQTVISGSAATIAVQVAPTNGTYPEVVSFTVTGLPPDATAIFSPATVAADGGPAPVNLSIQTASLTRVNRLGANAASIALGLLLLPFLGARRKRLLGGGRTAGRYIFMVFVLVTGAIGMAGLTGCGSHNGFFGHAPKTYNITITATSGTIQHSVNTTLNVQ